MIRIASSSQVPLPGRARRADGFTLIEAVITFSLIILIMGGLYSLFETNTRVSRVQTDISDMQQGQRIAQHDIARILQMAGRGGIPLGTLPLGTAVGVQDGVAEPTYINPGQASTPKILAGTDVLTVRGVFSNPIWQTPQGVAITYVGGQPPAATAGTLQLRANTDASIPQALAGLGEALCNGRPEALVLVSNFSDQVFALAELDPATSSSLSCVNGRPSAALPDPLTVGFFITGGTQQAVYAGLLPGGGFTPQFLSAKYVAILEEYRYYVREQRSPANELVPSLSMARVYPGTTTPWNGSAANWAISLVDNIFDLQLVLGVDTDGNGRVVDGKTPDSGVTPATDEWLYNAAADIDTAPTWNTGTFSYLRVTTLVRSARRDFGYEAPPLTAIENHDFAASPLNAGRELWFRRRTLTTTVDVRNVG